MEAINVKVVGISPLLMHNTTFTNPLHEVTIKHKELTSVRKKTEEVHLMIMESEWRGSLYYKEGFGVYLPGTHFEASIFEAAKLQKLGKQAKRAIMILENECKIEYDGPRTPDALFKDKRFVDVRPVRVQQAKVIRARPKFDQWATSFILQFNPDLLQKSEVTAMLAAAGGLMGVGDYRPRFGRFDIQ